MTATSEAVFDAAWQHFEAARGRIQPRERSFLLQGRSIRVCYASARLEEFLSEALAHLASPPGEAADLTICVWDGLPAPWWNPRTASLNCFVARRGDVPAYRGDPIEVAFSYPGCSLHLYHRTRRLALLWCADAGDLPSYERGAPFRTILHWWVRNFDEHLVHAGAVGIDGAGVLLVGRGGSGKSTTTLLCLSQGMQFAGDDFCLLRAGSSQTFVASLYSSAKVNSDNLQRVEQFSPVRSFPNEKAIFQLHASHPTLVVPELLVRAVLLPTVTDMVDTTIRPATLHAALSATLLSTVRLLPGADEGSVRFIERVLASLPCYHLELGTDTRQIPRAIATLCIGQAVS